MTSLTKKTPHEYDFANYNSESDYEAIHRDLHFLKVSHVAAQIVSTPASEYGEGREGIVISTPYGIRGAWLDRPDDVILFLMGGFAGYRASRYRSTPTPPLYRIVKYVDPGAYPEIMRDVYANVVEINDIRRNAAQSTP